MKTILFIFYFLFFIFCSGFAQNGWNLITPKPARFQYLDFYCFSKDEAVIAGDYGNIMKTTNGGSNWIHFGYIDNFFGSINSVYFVGNTGWCVCDSSVVFKSTNKGDNWIRINNPGFSFSNFSSVYFLNLTTGYVVSSGKNILKTTNGGLNWFTLYNFSINGTLISPYFISESTGWIIESGMNGVYSYGNLYKTTNGGTNWTQQYNAVMLSKVKFFNENTGYVAGGNGSPAYRRGFFLKTTNGGTNWNKQYIDSVSGFFDIDFINQNTGWVSGNNIIYKTTNAGNSWSGSNFSPMYFKAADNNNLWGIKQYEIFKSSGSGSVWDTVSYNLIPLSESISNIFFLNENIGWGTLFFDVIKSTDGGYNWKTYNVPNAREISSIIFANDNTGWVTSYEGVTDSVYLYKSTNGGANWIYANPSNKISSLKQIKYFSPSNLILFGYLSRPLVNKSVILRSTNLGLNWTLDSLDDSYNIIICDFNNFWACNLTKLLKSSNGGAGWQEINVPGIVNYGNGFFINQNTGFVSINNNANVNINYIHRTFNGGVNWDSIYTGSNAAGISNYYYLNNILWAVGRDNASYPIVIKMTNNFSNWDVYRLNGNRLWCDLFSIYFINNNTGWISGGWTEVYKTTNGSSSFISKINNNFSTNYLLYQNYPNPFNPSTTIKFEIPNSENGKWKIENGVVTLKIFDILGKEIEMLVNENLKTGTYEVKFDGSRLASGVYFYTITAGEFKETMKALLIK
jgi:photosystem II stability/assembly factor-like uncharacterized protein